MALTLLIRSAAATAMDPSNSFAETRKKIERLQPA
jgi:hypothetical protein